MYINVLCAPFPAIIIIMAKAASLFNGTTAGKVGEVVFFRANGQQRARQYVAQVNDAKTESQVTQRVALSPCILAYRFFKTILADSFPSSSIGVSGYNAFVGLNKTKNIAYFTKENVANYAFSMAPYQMSKGTLLAFPAGSFSTTKYEVIIPNGAGTGIENFKTDYMAAFPDALSTDKLIYARIASDSGEGLECSTKVLSFTLNDSAFPAAIAYTAGKLIVTLPFDSTNAEVAVVFIRSQRDLTGKINVSSQSLQTTTKADETYTMYSGANQKESALLSYGYNANKVI